MQDAVHLGLSALPATACTTNASLITSGTGTDQLSVSSGKTLLQATQTGVTIPTVTTVTNQLTTAVITSAIWKDTTSGDFTVSGSIGKSLFTSGNAPGAASGLAIVGSNVGTTSGISGVTFPTNFGSLAIDGSGFVTYNNAAPPTAATIATAVWTDTTSGDFTTSGSPGKILVSQLGGTFTTTSSAIFSAAALANAPSGSGPTASQIATAVWTDTTSGDFTTTGSPGKILVSQLGGTFTTTSSAIFSAAALANAPSGGGTVTANVTQINGIPVNTAAAQIGVNVVNFNNEPALGYISYISSSSTPPGQLNVP